jgi:hypothetical protein
VKGEVQEGEEIATTAPEKDDSALNEVCVRRVTGTEK